MMDTSVAGTVERSLASLKPRSSCGREVIQSALPHCKSITSSQDRVLIAINLSLCEFSAAGIDYPSVCADAAKWRICASELEAKAQWWTTFSGNYREIGQICLEHQQDSVIESFIELHENLSHVHTALGRELEALLHEVGAHNSRVEAIYQKYTTLSAQIQDSTTVMRSFLDLVSTSVVAVKADLMQVRCSNQCSCEPVVLSADHR